MKKLPNVFILMLCLVALTFVHFGCCEDCDEESPTDTDLELNVSPETRITGGPSGTVDSGDVTFTWTGGDMQDSPGELVYSYRLDPVDGGWSEFDPSTLVQYSGLDDGDYTFQVKARNTRGYEDLTPAQRSFSVDTSDDGGDDDTTPPETTITDGPEGTVNTGDVYFEWTGTDDTDPTADLTYSYDLDGTGWSAYAEETSTTFTDLADGEHTFQVRARDTSGNVDPTPASRTFTVDTSGGGDRTPPETTITSGPEGTVDTPDVTFTYIGSDDVDPPSALVYSYQMDSEGWSSYSGETTAAFTGLADGEHEFRVRARDTSGNVDQSPATRVFIVDTGGPPEDTTPPQTTITSGPSGTVDTPDVTFTYIGSDDVDPPDALTYSYRMDSDSWSAYSSATEASFTGLEDGNHTFRVRARDTSGNVDPTPATRDFTVDTGGTANEVEFHFPTTSATGNPGERVVIIGEVTNNMDTPAELHFFITTNMPPGWVGSFCVLGVCVFEEITITMDPNSTEEVEVDFDIAADATSGDSGTIDLNVELVANPSINDHVRLTVTVN